MKKTLKISIVLIILLIFTNFYVKTVLAEEEIIVIEEEIIEPININLKIRSGAIVFFDNFIELSPVGETEINGHALNARSVLSILNKADLNDENWNISDLQYFESFGSFLLNCISSSVGNDCYNWQYAVNGQTPGEGMDKKILSGGENIYIYFSPQNKITLNSDNINTNNSLLATAEKYNFENDTWIPATDMTLGITQPDPANPFNPPIEIMTGQTNLDGQVTFTSILAGLYDVGIRDNFGYYFPTKPLTVTTPPPPSGGSGGSSPDPEFNVPDAISYLKNAQNSNGSFNDSTLYTDWAAIAYGAGKVSGNALNSILEYFNSQNKISSLITDNERRAMALLSLGKNPYSFNNLNYIKAITDEFDGTQFGDKDLINDDIFALIPLNKAGYDEDEEIITKTINFIISKQKGSGSWEDSVDITAAAILALNSFNSIIGVPEALLKATTYLENYQNNDGSWGNISSTSWVIQAETALGTSWSKNGKSGLDYLARQQENANNNGAVLPSSETLENIIWATSYAIPAGLGKPWNEIMKSVSRPKEEESSSSDDGSEETETPDTTIQEDENNLYPINAPIIQEQIIKTQEVKNLPNILKNNTPPEIEKNEEINSNIFTATAINTIQEQNQNTFQNIPIIFGTISGIILLFALLKYFSIF